MITSKIDTTNKLLTLVINRAHKKNALNGEMCKTLYKNIKDAYSNDQIHCILIRAEGDIFCSGQDLEEIEKNRQKKNYTYDETIIKYYIPLITAIVNIPKPVVCIIQGMAVGAGVNIALACDIVIASNTASFIQVFSQIGLVPDSGGTFFLPRLVGWAKASAWMMTGEKISAKEAESSGMIYKCIPNNDLPEYTDLLCKKLLSTSLLSLGFIKQALRKSPNNNLDTQLKLEADLQKKAGASQEHHLKIKRFFEKRKAKNTKS